MGAIFGFSHKLMKQYAIFLILLSIFSIAPLANAHNPFTTKPENQHVAPTPVINSKIFAKIIIWQHKLKAQMSSLVRQAESTGSIKPLLLLIIAAFSYGAIHAAGPGHGKAIALSYVLSQRPSYIQGLLFSNCMALFHGASGIIFVLVVRLILKTNIIKNLEAVTNITQVVSYSIIICFGFGLFIHSIYKLLKRHNPKQHSSEVLKSGNKSNPVLLALVIGSIPCPGVVMVMLFTLSMDLITLGIILGITISLGMALTISIIVLIAISGKIALFTTVARNSNQTVVIEYGIEIFASILLMVIGILFLGASL
jgi:nickel/cobalt transporter (NicO) family protein